MRVKQDGHWILLSQNSSGAVNSQALPMDNKKR